MASRLLFVPRHRAVAALALVLSTALVAAAPYYAVAQGSPDASCPGPGEGVTSTSGNNRLAQTFIAQTTGSLTRAQVTVVKNIASTDWIVQIYATDDTGTPSGSALTSSSVSDALVPMGDSTLDVTFATPATVVAGRRYAVAVTRPGSAQLDVRIRTGNVCEGRFFVATTGAFTEISPNFDMVFTVFVEPAPPPEPQPEQGAKANRTVDLDANKNKVKKGKRVTLSGRLAPAARQGPCESGQTVELQRKRPSRATFTTFAAVQTDAQGSFSLKKKVKKTFEYRAQVVETATCTSALSNTEKVKVKKKK